MEKLIELLNEYAKVLGIGDYVGWHNEETVKNSDYIITKNFGFISWLVDNDKIDTSYKKHGENRPYKLHQFSGKVEKYSPYEAILMLLSISDSPTEFLISILK